MLEHIPSIRAHFPGLSGETVFLDNAGGSQLPSCVIDAMCEYMRSTYVQLNGDCALSKKASAVIPKARETVKIFLNGHDGKAGEEKVGGGLGDVIFGSSSTVLCYQLAAAYADARDATLHPEKALPGMRPLGKETMRRDKIVVCTAGHEANVGPWMRLGLRGYTIVPWQAEPVKCAKTGRVTWKPSADTLKTLVDDRTLLVLVPQVSNILGEVWDVRTYGEIAHAAGAKIVVDGVAYAPHRAPDVADLGCDWYVYSTYKVFGPHMAAMFGTKAAMGELTGANHYFIDGTTPYKWELGNASHEGAAGVVAMWGYVRELMKMAGDASPGVTPERKGFDRGFGVVREIEEHLQAKFMGYLQSKKGVRIIGPEVADGSRVSIVSFTSTKASPSTIGRHLGERNIAMRWGHAYSKRLVDAMSADATLGIHPTEGIARVSLQHYNTVEEVERVCGMLEEIL